MMKGFIFLGLSQFLHFIDKLTFWCSRYLKDVKRKERLLSDPAFDVNCSRENKNREDEGHIDIWRRPAARCMAAVRNGEHKEHKATNCRSAAKPVHLDPVGLVFGIVIRDCNWNPISARIFSMDRRTYSRQLQW